MWVDLGELLGVLPADTEWRGGLEGEWRGTPEWKPPGSRMA